MFAGNLKCNAAPPDGTIIITEIWQLSKEISSHLKTTSCILFRTKTPIGQNNSQNQFNQFSFAQFSRSILGLSINSPPPLIIILPSLPQQSVSLHN